MSPCKQRQRLSGQEGSSSFRFLAVLGDRSGCLRLGNSGALGEGVWLHLNLYFGYWGFYHTSISGLGPKGCLMEIGSHKVRQLIGSLNTNFHWRTGPSLFRWIHHRRHVLVPHYECVSFIHTQSNRRVCPTLRWAQNRSLVLLLAWEEVFIIELTCLSSNAGMFCRVTVVGWLLLRGHKPVWRPAWRPRRAH